MKYHVHAFAANGLVARFWRVHLCDKFGMDDSDPALIFDRLSLGDSSAHHVECTACNLQLSRYFLRGVVACGQFLIGHQRRRRGRERNTAITFFCDLTQSKSSCWATAPSTTLCLRDRDYPFILDGEEVKPVPWQPSKPPTLAPCAWRRLASQLLRAATDS